MKCSKKKVKLLKIRELVFLDIYCFNKVFTIIALNDSN